MPEKFTGSSPEDYFSQHKELAAEFEAAKQDIADVAGERAEREREYQDAKKEGFDSYQDDLEARPPYMALNYKKEVAEQKAADAQKIIDAQAELGKTHYEVNEAAYREEAARIDAEEA